MSRTLRQTDHLVEDLRMKRLPIDERCEGCGKVIDERGVKKCMAYVNPQVKWKLGHCHLANHVVVSEEQGPSKVRVGQQKQKKKSRR